ncbi:hypothetical protein H072_1913 [Dactylellina haptotyla CBS 200.50]|uniref:Uncharacterized protein n=1 Tax=Dactylellina haptotyla (strain CBS 200.50) TaxID=1284197 RepID=S8AME8_DACHA|nr:hypothetical protein H072_1913 [Dactylellina haptotyla CBS 200.50]
MAGTSGLVEIVDRGDWVTHQHPPSYQCNQSSESFQPSHVPRSENVELATPHYTENAQKDGERDSHTVSIRGASGIESSDVSNLYPAMLLENLKERIAGLQIHDDDDDDDDDNDAASFQEQQISFHRSKVIEGLSQGEWDEAENHLSILLNDFAISDSPDMVIFKAMTYNSRAKWDEAVDLLKDFKHQSTSESELSVRAYYARGVALYKLKDYGAAHMNARRGLNVTEKYLQGEVQRTYKSKFGDLASRSLEDLGNKADSAKAEFYKSLITPEHTSDPILLVTTVSQSIIQRSNEESEAEHTKLLEDMKTYRLSFGYDGKLLVGRQRDFFTALYDALAADNLPLMTLICSNEWCATQTLRESPIYFDLDPPMPQYAWRATTLLHVVAGSHSKYSAPMAQVLLDNGADPQKTLFEGITPLHICARQTNAEVASVLIKNGANIEARSITGKPPIHFAAWKASWNADVRILKMLIAAGANINAKNSGGYTALHWCMFDGRSAAPIEVLCERPEIDKFARAGNHKTPWEIFWEHEEEMMQKGEEKRVQILYTLRRFGITR